MKKLDFLTIPEPILYDDKLNLSEKFILSIITGILKHNEKCFASNAYFSEITAQSQKTVSRTLQKLKANNYISFHGSAFKRTISIIRPEIIEFLSEKAMDKMSGDRDNLSKAKDKMSGAMDKMSTYNNNYNNNKNNNYKYFNKQNENISSYNDKPSYNLEELMKIK